MEARYVGAKSQKRTVWHAVWVTHNTTPITERIYSISYNDQRRLDIKAGVIREGLSVCGVKCPSVIAGKHGGHDWLIMDKRDKCINCQRALGELD